MNEVAMRAAAISRQMQVTIALMLMPKSRTRKVKSKVVAKAANPRNGPKEKTPKILQERRPMGKNQKKKLQRRKQRLLQQETTHLSHLQSNQG